VLAKPGIPGGDIEANRVQIDHTKNTYLPGTATVAYVENVSTFHSVFELGIDLSIFGGQKITHVHWGPSCGNDLLDLEMEMGSGNAIPEPSSWALFALGLFGIGAFVRRRPVRALA
jgi:hypothetical protein